MRLFPRPRKLEVHAGRCSFEWEEIEEVENADLKPGGFRVEADERGVRIEASGDAGFFYGRQVLKQALEASEDHKLPCMVVEDWPEFEFRGYMLDISRDRVPTMERLYEFVDLLALLRYNQLQLYTEHTFAFQTHRTVWENASPLTADEVLDLDLYCRERYIELVPNQNSFGHMERWLCHPEYHHLAECPDGFEHPIAGKKDCGSVLKPESESLEFLDELFGELLPNFASKKFNIGGDEPWELGMGVSRPRVEEVGKQAVYLDFISKVCELAQQHGAEPMCWADILLEEPNSIHQLPDGITPVLWGYEADHPFDEQCEVLASLGRPFYIAPGDSTWTSHTGRRANMLGNVRSALESGKKYGASGILLTHWGDGGHPQPRVVSLPALVRAGLGAWNLDTIDDEGDEMLRASVELLGSNEAVAALVLRAGELDDVLKCPMVNRSFLANSFRMCEVELAALESVPTQEALLREIEECDALLERCEDVSGFKDVNLEELTLAIRMNRFAAYRCLGRANDAPESGAALAAEFERLWLVSSRPGGLIDSLSKQKGFQ